MHEAILRRLLINFDGGDYLLIGRDSSDKNINLYLTLIFHDFWSLLWVSTMVMSRKYAMAV